VQYLILDKLSEQFPSLIISWPVNSRGKTREANPLSSWSCGCFTNTVRNSSLR